MRKMSAGLVLAMCVNEGCSMKNSELKTNVGM